MGRQIDDDRWLIAEMDGRELHEMPVALFRDRSRQSALIASGRVEVLRSRLRTSRDGARSHGRRQALAGLGAAGSAEHDMGVVHSCLDGTRLYDVGEARAGAENRRMGW